MLKLVSLMSLKVLFDFLLLDVETKQMVQVVVVLNKKKVSGAKSNLRMAM